MVFIRGNKFGYSIIPQKRRQTYALSFDGITGNVNCGNSTSLNIANSLSIFTTVSFSSFPTVTNGTIIRKGTGTPETLNYMLYIDSSQAKFYVGSGSSSKNKSTGTLSLLNYHAIAGTFDSVNGLKIYLNGVQIGTTAATGFTANQNLNSCIIADFWTANVRFKGLMKSMSVFNIELTSAQVSYLSSGSIQPNDISGCVLYHNYTRGSAQDLSGNNNNGILTGKASFVPVDWEYYY